MGLSFGTLLHGLVDEALYLMSPDLIRSGTRLVAYGYNARDCHQADGLICHLCPWIVPRRTDKGTPAPQIPFKSRAGALECFMSPLKNPRGIRVLQIELHKASTGTRVPRVASKEPTRGTRVLQVASKEPTRGTRVLRVAAKEPTRDTRVLRVASKEPTRDTRVPPAAFAKPNGALECPESILKTLQVFVATSPDH